MAKELTTKQGVFVAEYLADFDGKRAAIAAGYSAKSAESQASQLLKNPKVSQEIAKETGKRLKKLNITADYVLQNIVLIGERCMEQKVPVMIGRGKNAHIATEVIDGEEFELYQFDAIGALKAQELLGKHLKLFTEKVEHTGKFTLEQLLTSNVD